MLNKVKSNQIKSFIFLLWFQIFEIGHIIFLGTLFTSAPYLHELFKSVIPNRNNKQVGGWGYIVYVFPHVLTWEDNMFSIPPCFVINLFFNLWGPMGTASLFSLWNPFSFYAGAFFFMGAGWPFLPCAMVCLFLPAPPLPIQKFLWAPMMKLLTSINNNNNNNNNNIYLKSNIQNSSIDYKYK